MIDETGEILGTGVAVTYEWEEVDDERFVKLFLAGLKQATGLSKRGLAVFQMVYDQLRENPRQDTVMLSVADLGIAQNQFLHRSSCLARSWLYLPRTRGRYVLRQYPLHVQR